MLGGCKFLRMAPGTTSGIRWRWPRNLISVCRMAGDASQGDLVRTGVLNRGMREADHRPIRIAMARRAVDLTHNVCRGHAQRDGVVMAAHAITR